VRSEYVARFNEGVRTGDWSRMLELLADDWELLARSTSPSGTAS